MKQTSHIVERQLGGSGEKRRLPVFKPVDEELSDELRREHDLRKPIPRTRAECPQVRPCPYWCKHNTWVVSGLNQPGRRWVDGDLPSTDLRPTVDQNCAADYYDVAEETREPIEPRVIAAVLGISDRQVRRYTASAMAALPERLQMALERDDERAVAVSLLKELMSA